MDTLIPLRGGPASPDMAPTAASWRLLLRALAEELDLLRPGLDRDALLRRCGHRLARLMPLPQVASLGALAVEANDALAAVGWGTTAMTVDQADRALRIHHTGLPRIGSLQAEGGPWLTALLEGLYEGWLIQQPGGEASLSARCIPGGEQGAIVLRYGVNPG
jgi:hypothetical protein